MTTPSQSPALVWLRDDLRLSDNPAIDAALATGRPVHLLYVLDQESAELRRLGGAAMWWLGRTLASLGERIEQLGGQLILRRGKADRVVPAVVEETQSAIVLWNRRYSAGEIALDTRIKANLTDCGTEVTSCNASLLHEPWTVLTQAKGPFRVFTPFFRAASPLPSRAVTREPASWRFATPIESETLADWKLEPTRPDWAGGLRDSWTPGEAGVRDALANFLDHGIHGYATLRDRPDRANTSRLSPFLRFGNISPHQALAALRHAEDAGDVKATDAAKFVSEIYWREFSYHLLFHYPDHAEVNFNTRFDAMEWRNEAAFETAWQRGRTGYPLIDAGMRELWQTGWMHNRVRMVVASFLIKHGQVDWRRGETWFWDTLVDADPAKNAASWQWLAGSGADAAPYFRVFNPIIQGEKFDPEGDYVRRFVPELAKLPTKFIHKPWQADAATLRQAGVTLGTTYPNPIVDHAAARERALASFARIRGD